MCASTGSVLGSCPKPPTFRFILFFDRVPNNSPRSSVTGDESIASACISSRAAFTETLLEMVLAGLMMSLTVRALKFVRPESLGFICPMDLAADAGLNERRLSEPPYTDEANARNFPHARRQWFVHYCTLTSRAFDLAFVVVGWGTFSTPSRNSAVTFVLSASSGSVKLRRKLPKDRSRRWNFLF